MSYVTVDAPKVDAANVPPTLVAATTPLAYVRFHGRNAGTWNARGGGASTRFDYLYGEQELREWVAPLRELAGASEEVYAFFNNNGRSPMPSPPWPEATENEKDGFVAQAPTNALMLNGLLA